MAADFHAVGPDGDAVERLAAVEVAAAQVELVLDVGRRRGRFGPEPWRTESTTRLATRRLQATMAWPLGRFELAAAGQHVLIDLRAVQPDRAAGEEAGGQARRPRRVARELS